MGLEAVREEEGSESLSGHTLIRIELNLSPMALVHREKLLFGRLLTSLIKLCPESPVTEARSHEHPSGEGVYLWRGHAGALSSSPRREKRKRLTSQ